MSKRRTKRKIKEKHLKKGDGMRQQVIPIVVPETHR